MQRADVFQALIRDKEDTDKAIVEHTSTAKKSSCMRYIEPTSQVVLGGIGIFSSLLYWNSMSRCAEMKKCAKWLADASSPEIAQALLYGSGGGGFAATSVRFSAVSVSDFSKLLQQTPSVGGKILKASFVASFIVVHSFGVYFAARSGTNLDTDLSGWQKFIICATIVGTIPGTLFTAVHFYKKELTQLYNFLKYSKIKLRQFSNYCAPSFFSFTEDERLILHYLHQQRLFLKRLIRNWQKQLDHLATAPSLFRGGDEALVALFRLQQADVEDFSWYWRVLKYSFLSLFLVGGSLLGSFVIPIALNNFNKVMHPFTLPLINLEVKIPDTIAGKIVGGGLSALLTGSGIYNSQTVLLGAASWLYHSISDLLSGRPIRSLALQLYPMTTLTIVVIALGTQWLSYSLVDVQLEENYKDEWFGKEFLRYLTAAGIDVFHSAAIATLGNILLSSFVQTRFVSNTTNKNIFALQNEIEELKRLPLNQFIAFVEKQVQAGNASVLGLEPYRRAGQLLEFHASRELLPSNPYENEESNEEWSGDEDVVSVERILPRESVAKIGFFGGSKNNMPAGLAEARQQRQASRRCCSLQ